MRTSIFLIILACCPVVAVAEDTAPVKKLESIPCAIPSLPKDARCGVYEVFENRAAQSGRRIPLQVVILPATGPERLPDPLLYFAGGPGSSSLEEGMWFAMSAPDLRKNRDVLLIDSRGTGRSAALVCDELRGTGSVQGFLEEYMPADKVRVCRDRIAKTADLIQYSTDNVVDDAEEIRTALGYGKVNVMGTSYGTRTVQIYLRRHPGSVRTAVMSGVLPIDEAFPLVTARLAQSALEGLIVECKEDPACGKAFPNLQGDVAAVFRQVAKEPVRAQAVNPETGQPFDVILSKNGLGQVLRRMLYYNAWISLTPLYLHLAANGDWQPLAEFAQAISLSQGGSSDGYYLSITCSEDLAFIRDEEIPAAVAGTFLGDLRVRKQLAACVGWPAPKLDPGFRVPVTSDVPTLLLSGGADPVTPPSSGERVARTLKRSRHVVVADGGHGLDGMTGGECVPKMVSAFIASGDAGSLDVSCAARMRRPDFLLSLKPEVKLKPEELERLTGTWLGKDGLKIRTEAVGGYLRVVFPNDSNLLAATSPTSFRLRTGEPGAGLTFNLQDGRAVSMTMEQADGSETLTREPPHPSHARLLPCKVPGKGEKQVDALCGVYEVWENREAKAGRKIGLKIVVLPALSSSPLPDPVFDLAGGPGAASTGSAGSMVKYPLRQERDLVFVDQRGTGEPDRLGCALAAGKDDLQSRLGELFPLDVVRRCRDELGKKYDLARYTVDAAVDDFDEIRAWLGYDKVNLFGSSYGTRTAQVYLRRHPESVRTVTLWGVVPMDEPVALSHAAGAQRSLDLLFDLCENDAACRAKFPGVRKDFQAVMDRVSQGPVEVEVAHPETGKATRVRLSREVVSDGIRIILYSAKSAAALPFLFHQAATGDWKPLGQTVVEGKAEMEQIITRGLFFSVTCSQDIPFIDPAEVPARTAGTFFGDYRVRQQTAACALWPHARIDPAETEAIHSDVPVLLVNGELDPVTPPDFGRRAARFLTQSLHVVEPYASHEESPLCVERISDELIRRGTIQGLDTSCVSQLKPVPFVLEMPKEGIKPFG